jgi:Family of unknown function (DUF6114)
LTTAHAPQAGGFVRGWRIFRRWRRARPFWGGLLLILSGLELFFSGNMNLGNLQVHFGPTGFLSYVIPAMVLLCGILAWASPNLRLFYGILGSLVAVYSLISLNLGGFFLGLIIGIIGGALTIAWTPITPAAPAVADGVENSGAAPAEEATEGAWFLTDEDDQRPRYDHGQPYEPPPAASNGHVYGVAHPAGTEPTPGYAADTEEIPREVQNPERWWGGRDRDGNNGDPEQPPHGGASGGYRNRLFAITLVPVTLAAIALTAIHQPVRAYAAPCPVTSASATPSVDTAKKAAQNNTAQNKATPKPAATKAPNGATAPKQAVPSASPSPSATSTSSGNPFVDGWNDFVDGVKKFFGGGDGSTPAPNPSQSASPSPSAATGGAPAKPAAPPDPAQSSTSASSAPAAPPSAAASEIPCLGAPVFKNGTVEPGQPPVAATQAVLTGASLTMINSAYEGVVDLPTRAGTVHSLKFKMSKAITKPFQLTIREPNGKTTVLTSTELTIEKSPDPKVTQDVLFYTPKFTGKLFGLIPVTFTPDSPPPPTFGLPLWFTDVTIDLAYVQSPRLTAADLHVELK